MKISSITYTVLGFCSYFGSSLVIKNIYEHILQKIPCWLLQILLDWQQRTWRETKTYFWSINIFRSKQFVISCNVWLCVFNEGYKWAKFFSLIDQFSIKLNKINEILFLFPTGNSLLVYRALGKPGPTCQQLPASQGKVLQRFIEKEKKNSESNKLRVEKQDHCALKKRSIWLVLQFWKSTYKLRHSHKKKPSLETSIQLLCVFLFLLVPDLTECIKKLLAL